MLCIVQIELFAACCLQTAGMPGRAAQSAAAAGIRSGALRRAGYENHNSKDDAEGKFPPDDIVRSRQSWASRHGHARRSTAAAAFACWFATSPASRRVARFNGFVDSQHDRGVARRPNTKQRGNEDSTNTKQRGQFSNRATIV